MKKIIVFAAVGALLAGCSDEVRNPDKPSNPGSDITFQINLQSDPQTRTLYGEETNNAFPIYWVDKDQIIVASPQCAAGRNNALYQVTVPNATSNTATAVTKVNEAGVQWGDKLPANFYSVYPAEYNATLSETVKNEIVNGEENAVAHLNVRNYQYNIFTKKGTTWTGVPYDRKSRESVDANLKNPDALMYAQTKQTTDGDVQLTYKPFTVAFHVELDGYTLGGSLGTDPSVTIQSIAIQAPQGTQLAGNFDATFNADCITAPVVNTNVNTLTNSNVIYIPTWTDAQGTFLTINKGEKVSFNVFAIPTGNTVTSDWTLTVYTNQGRFSRKLTPGNGTNAGQLIAGQMHKLNMPAFQINQNVTLNVENWMAQIPRNTYLSELSIPGAWYATQSEYQGSTNYASLWNAGVRAFAIETRTSSNVPLGSIHWTPNSVVISGTGKNTSLGTNAYRDGTNISNAMSGIISQLQNNQGEYAVLVLTYADGGDGGHREEDYAFWLQGIYNSFNSLTTAQKRYVYQDAITPNTVVNDVLGKLIIMVNAGGSLPGGNITIGNYGNNLPGLISYTDLAWESTSQNSSLMSQMHWMNWSNDYMTNVSLGEGVTTLPTANLYLNYALANRTAKDTGAGIPTYTNRQNSISTILTHAAAVRNAGTHNVWPFIGAGGNQATSSNSNTNAGTAQSFATTMNPWILKQLTTKLNNKDYTPFGLVFCNYITNATYHGPEVIAKIIDMNTKAELAQDPDQEPWPGTTQQNSPANYSSVHTMAGNAWTVNQ